MKLLRNLYLSMLVAMAPSTSYCNKAVVIRAMRASETEFQSWLVVHGQYTSYAEALILESNNSRANKALEELLLKAQHSYLTAPLDEALAGFIKVTGLSLQEDWNLEQRKALFHAHLRIAQLSTNNKNNWIKKATCFSPDLAPNPDMFSQDFISQWRLINKKIDWITTTAKITPFSRLMVNGRELKKSSPIKLCRQKYRVTWLANHLQKVSKVIHASQLQSTHLDSQPLAEGSCEWPRYHSKINATKTYKVYFHPECIKESTQRLMSLNAAVPITQQPTKTAAKKLRLPELHVTQKASTSTFLSKNWIWVTALALGTGAAIAYNNSRDSNESRKKRPSSKTGL